MKVSKYLNINELPWAEGEKTEIVLRLQYVAQEKSFPTQLAPVAIVHWCLLLATESAHHA